MCQHGNTKTWTNVRGVAIERGHLWTVAADGVRRVLVMLEDIRSDT